MALIIKNEKKSASTDYIKENPIKAVVAVLCFCGSLVVGSWAVEDRYALKQELSNTKEALKTEREASFHRLKDLIIIIYEDKIDDLNFKVNSGGATPYDKTRLNSMIKRVEALKGIEE